MAANGSTCQVSLSELSRLPVSNLRLSAHISAPWTRKKKKKDREKCRKGNKASTESNEVDELRRCIVSSRRCPLTGSGGPGWWWRPRGLCLSVCGPLRPPRCLPGSELWKPHRLFVQQKKKKRAAAQDFAKLACLNFYFCFLTLFLGHGEPTGPSPSAHRIMSPPPPPHTVMDSHANFHT